ncbi:hypothetical protein GGR54DRAFT_344450 [Hypoxylon sp. NC1633]|nr:hypothetical protein GGR54DRAFT_344450 [Hypoxylon sp. NC1633]
MCYQLIEKYSACHCLYYQHAVDRCPAYHELDHPVTRRTILVGYACLNHASNPSWNEPSFPKQSTSKVRVGQTGENKPSKSWSSKVQSDSWLQAVLDQLTAKRSPGPVADKSTKKGSAAVADIQKLRPSTLETQQLEKKSNPRPLVSSTKDNELRGRHSAIWDSDSEGELFSYDDTSSDEEISLDDDMSSIKDPTNVTAKDSVKNAVKAPVEDSVKNAVKTPVEESVKESAKEFSFDDDMSSVKGTIKEFLFDDDDDDAPSQTSISSIESATAIDHLTDGFLYDNYLDDLWPQLFRRSESLEEAKEQISLLILRYSFDLQKLARNQNVSEESVTLKLRASRFVKRERRHLAREIYKKFWEPVLAASQPASQPGVSNVESEKILDDEPENESDVDCDEEENQEPEVDRFLTLKEFLFNTEPFYCFRENVRLFVEKDSADSLRNSWFDTIRIFFHNTITSVYRPATRGNTKRLHWTCACGLRLHDDYTEIQAGALENLKKQLSNYGIRSRTSPNAESSKKPALVRTSNNNSQSSSPSGSSDPKSFDTRLPLYWQKKKTVEPGTCFRVPMNDTHIYLLACLPFGRWVSKLHQPEICTITSDQDFFTLLRVLYAKNRQKLSLSWLRRVEGIHFVQFDVHRTEIASVRSEPALPPENMKGQYQYDPMPAQLVPPIGPNMLVHFFENPTHAGVLPDLYKRIPKKLREKLTPCQVTGMSVGWGIQFVEGMDTFIFFICVCVCFLACMAVAVCYSITRQDLQGGVGLGGLFLTFMLFCAGVVRSSLIA